MVDRRDRYTISKNYKNYHYKYIKYSDKSPILKIINDNLFHTLLNEHVLKSEIFKRKNAFILKTKKLNTIVYPCDLTVIQFINLAITILKLETKLNNYNYRLDDIHPWNFLYNNSKFHLVDLGAIEFENISNHWLKVIFGHNLKHLMQFILITYLSLF